MKVRATKSPRTPRVRPLTVEEVRGMFEREARRYFDMSGEEFLRKWDAGEFKSIIDDPRYHNKLIGIAMLLPFIGRIPVSDDK